MSFLELQDVHKRYGGVVALRGASLRAERGEVHALIGANGSGKSTLNKILTGVVAPDAAAIRLDGQPLVIRRPADAQRHGIAAVYQELSLVPGLSVTANMALASEQTRGGFLRRGADRARAAAVLEEFRDGFRGGRLPLDARVGSLPPGEQQLIEIAKAVAREPSVLMLDEATASLYSAQVEVLFNVVRRLRERGTLILFTSHRLNEVFGICERATVLRNGEVAGDVTLAETSEAALVELMVGDLTVAAEDIGEGLREEGEDAHSPIRLRVEALATDDLHDVSFEVRRGEVLGLGGLEGQGQSALLAALFGAARHRAGRVELDGDAVNLHTPARAKAHGIALVPGNRGREGLLPVRPILENLTVPSMQRRARPRGVLSQRRETAAAKGIAERLALTYGRLDDGVMTLSGGNQQKVVVGKWLLTDPKVVLLDDPTKGIDVRAKEELYGVIAELTANGVSVLLNSSEDDELLTLSHRVLVFFEGRIKAELAGAARTRDRLVAASLQVAAV